ncbi:MAG: serine/threonine-protein phosphatase [Firmicutes bacterium]|nr:serine/threonine-protein phosphatase [Bacillota bacterium]
MQLVAAQLSKTGGRKENQDYCACLNKGGYGCYLVADGLGGHRGGALAARTAGESILKAFAASPGASIKQLKGYLDQAREEMLLRGKQSDVPLRLKTTLVVLLSDFESALWAHIGDSRLYYFKAATLHFQTSDHSVPQQLVKSGVIAAEQVRDHEDRNRLLAAFDGGDLERIEYAVEPVKLERDDAFLLCTDGFWECVYENEMEEDLAGAANPDGWLGLMEKRLLMRAKHNNDNYTALAVLSREK